MKTNNEIQLIIHQLDLIFINYCYLFSNAKNASSAKLCPVLGFIPTLAAFTGAVTEGLTAGIVPL